MISITSRVTGTFRGALAMLPYPSKLLIDTVSVPAASEQEQLHAVLGWGGQNISESTTSSFG